jgi:hypothetical protein
MDKCRLQWRNCAGWCYLTANADYSCVALRRVAGGLSSVSAWEIIELRVRGGERLVDGLGRYGYSAHFSGSWVCYTCGVLCECGEGE